MSERTSFGDTTKRVIDALCSAIILIAFLPVLVATALVTWASVGRPILWRQQRPGRYAAPFYLLKFRTMTSGTDERGVLLPDAQRLNRVGALMRAWSLDELPQLWNVLKGEMSLVGPRPLLMQYLQRYTPEQARRHEVRPGITGWAQVNGRNAISWQERFELDVWYVEHRSFLLDMRILAITVWCVLTKRGISAPGEATMPEFRGCSRS